jgi:hypothetical protein
MVYLIAKTVYQSDKRSQEKPRTLPSAVQMVIFPLTDI